jgi:iron complex outermembrane receptor protein
MQRQDGRYIKNNKIGRKVMNKRYFLFFMTLTIGFILAFGDVSALFAQETDAEEFTLEEIIVTAQKREENQQKVPIAMEVIKGDTLALMGKDNVDDILKDVSNVMINTSSDGMRVSMRGIADDSGVMEGQHVGGSTVAINVDGAYNNMSNVGNNLFDVERVEVLFGPQSTMYGSNSPGGIINVETANPKTDQFSASGTVEYGTSNLLNVQAMLNAPVVQDKFALRLAANKSLLDSYVQPDSKANDTTAVRLKALWSATDTFEITVTGNWQNMINGGMMSGGVVPFVNQDDVEDPWTWDGQGVGNSEDQTTKGVNANIVWNTSIGNFELIPSYNESESTGRETRTQESFPGGPMVTQTFDMGRGNTQEGADLRITNSADFTLFTWILGGTYYKSEQKNTTDYVDPTSVDESRTTTQSKEAIYANATVPISDRFRLNGGYRQSWDESKSTSTGNRAETSGNPEGYNKPDYKAGLEYDAAENVMLYGNYASSYRSGDSMAMADADGNYPDPEELDSYTIGLKSRWLENKLQFNVTAYWYDYKNKLCTGFKQATGLTEEDLGDDYISIGVDDRGNPSAVQTPDGQYPTMDVDPVTGAPTDADKNGEYGDIYNFQINDPNSQGTGTFTSKGIDLQTTWVPTGSDRVNLSISYLDAQWETLSFHYYWSMYWPDENYEGLTPTNSPKWSVTGNYEHVFMLGGFGTLTPRIDLYYKSEYSMIWNPADKDPLGYGVQEAYTTFDLSAALDHSSGRWSLNAYCKNVTNYAVKKSYMGMMSYTMMIGDPRTYGASLSVRF